jgi:hypothetical protein
MLKKPASEMKEGYDSKSDLVRDVFETCICQVHVNLKIYLNLYLYLE